MNKNIKICETNKAFFYELRKRRADWGHEKYGDRDIYRDSALDMMEESADIINILERRIHWYNEYCFENKIDHSFAIDLAVQKINNKVEELNELIKKFDLELRNTGYEVNDSNGGTRIGL